MRNNQYIDISTTSQLQMHVRTASTRTGTEIVGTGRNKVLSVCVSMCVYDNLYLYHQIHAVVQSVEALRYKAEGRGFDFRWCHWNFSLT
jgi:hypothetical protein